MDIFDRMMVLPGLRVFARIYKRHKPVLLYLLFGALTTCVSIGSFALCIPYMDALLANVISWVFAVSFAYLTNRTWVFPSKAKGKSILTEAASFYGGRLSTLAFEELFLYVFITVLHFAPIVVKLIGQVAVMILNYFVSKFLVFHKH